MVLISRVSPVFSMPMRWMGCAASVAQGVWHPSGSKQNPVGGRAAFGASFPDVAANPTGACGDGWLLPMTAGEISTHFEFDGEGTLTVSLAGGRNGELIVEGVGTMTAEGALIASGAVLLTGIGTMSATAVGALSAAVAMAGQGNLTAALGAIADVIVSMSGQGTLNATARATGDMEVIITPFSELSPQSLAAAVWDELLVAHQNAGSAGEYLFSAGGGSSPSAIAAAVLEAVVEGTITLAESIRLMNAVLAGKVSGAGTGTETFRDLADTKARVVATVDASGNRTVVVRDVDDP